MNSNLILTPTTGMSYDQWLSFRLNGIGASEIGAVMGLSQYKSGLELFHEKASSIIKYTPENMAMFMGHEMEDLIAKMWSYWDIDSDTMIQNYRQGKIVRKMQKVNAYVQNPKYPWLFVSLDRKINKHIWKGESRGEGALELKTISQFEARKWEAEIPPQYLLQVMQQMIVCEFEYGEIAILQDGRKLDILPLELTKNIANQIIEESYQFWEKVKLGRKLYTQKFEAQRNFNQRLAEEIQAQIYEVEPPADDSIGFEEYMRETYKISNDFGRTGNEIELDYAKKHKEGKEIIKKYEKNVREAQNYLMNEMREVECLDFGKNGKVYWKTDKRGVRTFRNNIK